MGEKLKLFIRTSSPFIPRIVRALKLKGLEYDIVYEDVEAAMASCNTPIHKNHPVLLVHGGKPIAEPLVIIEYIDQIWNQNPLLPQDPYQRALARFWAKFAEEKLLSSTKNALLCSKEEEVGEKSRKEALESWEHLEEELKGKKFFGGEGIGNVDIAVGWTAYSLTVWEEMIGHIRPSLITQQRFPLLSNWTREFSAAPIINENWPPLHQVLRWFVESEPQYQFPNPTPNEIESRLLYDIRSLALNDTEFDALYETQCEASDEIESQELHRIQYQASNEAE